MAGSTLRTYFVNRLRSLSDVLVPPGLAKLPEIAEFALNGRAADGTRPSR